MPNFSPCITNTEASGAQVIDGSLGIGTHGRLQRTPAASGSLTSWSLSGWVKRDRFGETQYLYSSYASSKYFEVIFNATDQLTLYNYASSGAATIITSQLFRDTNWYHIHFKVDSVESAAADKLKLYVNGSEVTTFSTDNRASFGNTYWNAGDYLHTIGGRTDADNSHCEGGLTNVYFIDGLSLGPEEFGYTDPLTGVWRPKKYTGDYNVSVGGDSLISGSTLLTWDDSPIGAYDLTNSDKTATTNDGNNSSYTNADVWSIAIPANTTYAWTLDITNGDTTGGWYFTDSQTASGTHADQRGGNSLGCRGGVDNAGYYGTFASANGGSDGTNKITLNSDVSPNGAKVIDFVVYRPSSGTGKVWVKAKSATTWIGGGDPTNTSSTPTFIIPDGTTYFGMIAYNRDPAQVFTFDELVTSATGVNSFYLPLDGNTPVGQDRSKLNPINNGTPWSSYITGSDYNSGHVKANMFNGSVTSGQYLAGSSSSVTITFPGNGLDFSYSLRIMAQVTGGSSNIVFNWSGGSHTESITAVGAVWWDVSADVTSPVTSITYTTQSGTAGPYINALEVDGVVLTNLMYGNSWISKDFFHGGSVGLDKATGAFPILNTVNGGRVAAAGIRTDTDPGNGPVGINTYCVLALPLVGNDDDVSNEINSGSTTKVITPTGTPTYSTAESNFYGGSYYFDGSSDYLAVTDSTDLKFGSGDYTIEFWVRPATVAYYWMFSKRNDYADVAPYTMMANTSGQFEYASSSDDSSYDIVQASFGSYKANEWTHVAVVKNGGVITGYCNGVGTVLATGVSALAPFEHAEPLHIADLPTGGSYDLSGYMQDFRIYKGGAKYTSDFIPASSQPDILPSTPSGVALGSELTKVTDGSVYFDGTSDSLTFETSSDLSLDGDFTIEFWAYPKSIAGDPQGSDPSPITMPTDGTSISQVFLWANNLQYTLYKSSAILSTANGTAVTDQWQHVAFTRSGTTVYAFFNGVLQGTATSSVTFGGTSGTFRIASWNETKGNYDGYLSNVRIVKGTAVYTSNFTPPTRALTNVTNTTLLCCQSNTSAIEAAVKPGTITAVGDAVATTSNPFNTDIDTVRGQETDYCAFNPLRSRGASGYDPVFSDSNLYMDGRGDGTGTISTLTGKFYFEVLIETVTNSGQMYIGVQDSAYTGPERSWNTSQIATLKDGGSFYGDGSTGTAVTYGAGDYLSFAVDADGNKMYIAKNGVYLNDGIPSEGVGYCFSDNGGDTSTAMRFMGGYTPFISDSQVGQKYRLNCGQRPFKYTPPKGFEPLNYANLQLTEVLRPEKYVGITSYTGTGSTLEVGGLNFDAKPDLLWVKSINSNTRPTIVFDTIRGAQEPIYTGENVKQDTAATSLQSFEYNGFITSTDYHLNQSAAYHYVVWAWKSGDETVTLAASDKNSVAYNQSEVWSDSVASSTGFKTNKGATKAFDGVTDATDFCTPGGNGYAEWTGSLTCNSTLDIYFGYAVAAQLNGLLINGVDKGTVLTTTSHLGWVTIPDPPKVITSIKWYATTGADWAGIGGIRVDGALLVDSGVSLPVNAPSATQSYRSNSKSGFAICKYVGNATAVDESNIVYHGLGKRPKFVILKNLDDDCHWVTWHYALGTTSVNVQTGQHALWLNEIDADQTTFPYWDGPPDDSFLYLDWTNHATSTNINSKNYISYLWAEVPGLQKFGKYQGTGHVDGPFVDLGFRPALVMIKRFDSSANWVIIDNVRDKYNVCNNQLYPNLSKDQNDGAGGIATMDLLSNGFKLRQADGATNVSGGQYVYAAWAENPMNNLYGGQSNAR